MKSVSLALLSFIFVGCLGCSSNQVAVSEEEVQAFLKPGETTAAKVVELFGAPYDEYGVSNRTVAVYQVRHGTQGNFERQFTGFQVIYDGGVVQKWSPIYSDQTVYHGVGKPASEKAGPSRAPVPLKFFLLSEEPITNGVRLELHSENVGWAPSEPHLLLSHFKFIELKDDKETPAILISFSEAEDKHLYSLSATNLGRRIAIVVGDRVIAAPILLSPISGGEFSISFPSFAERDLALDCFNGRQLP